MIFSLEKDGDIMKIDSVMTLKVGDQMEIETVVEKKSFHLLHKAIVFKASDIHIIPDEKQYEIYFRKYGKLVPIESFPDEIGSRVITYLKFLSGLDISEKRKPQSGAFQKKMNEQLFSFRVSTLPSVYNRESLVIRLLLQQSTIPIQQLSFSEEMITPILKLVENKQGLLLITGATGSGKTTTLYSLIHHCTKELLRHVISLEDPVERTQNHMLQIQVNERAGVTYSAGLRAILRHTPDVILIGEIRDRETAQIAFEAALTGHLVLSSIHSKDSVSCLYRLFDLGIPIEELRQGIIGIAAQTLVEVGTSDERKAVFELLTDHHLKEAIEAFQLNKDYVLPSNLSLASQIQKLELMSL